MKSCFYIGDDDDATGYFTVEFVALDSGAELVRHFHSPVEARKFAIKVRKSKKLILIGTGGF